MLSKAGTFPVDGEDNNVTIDSEDLQLSPSLFDSGFTCRIYKGKYLLNGIYSDVACKEFLLKITPKYRRRIEKELKCIVKLKHPNVIRHFGIELKRSIVVTEYVEKEVRMTDGEIEINRISHPETIGETRQHKDTSQISEWNVYFQLL